MLSFKVLASAIIKVGAVSRLVNIQAGKFDFLCTAVNSRLLEIAVQHICMHLHLNQY